MSAVYNAQCKTFKVAREMTGTTRMVTRISAAWTPPYCLRVVRAYRTPKMQQFRDAVAKKVREMRNSGLPLD